MTREALRVTTTVPVAPTTLYYAWLDGVQHTAMTGGTAKLEPEVGAKFSALDGYITGQIVALDLGRRILMSWRTSDFPAEAPDSRVEVHFEALGGSTRVLVLHTEIPEGQSETYRGTWNDKYFQPMRIHFSKFLPDPRLPPPVRKPPPPPEPDDEEEEDDESPRHKLRAKGSSARLSSTSLSSRNLSSSKLSKPSLSKPSLSKPSLSSPSLERAAKAAPSKKELAPVKGSKVAGTKSGSIEKSAKPTKAAAPAKGTATVKAAKKATAKPAKSVKNAAKPAKPAKGAKPAKAAKAAKAVKKPAKPAKKTKASAPAKKAVKKPAKPAKAAKSTKKAAKKR